MWGQFRPGNFREGKSSAHLQFWCKAINTPNPCFLVGNQLLETLVCPNFEQYQIIRHKKQKRSKAQVGSPY